MGAVQSRGLYRRLAVSLAVLGAAAAFVPQAVADDGPVAVTAAAADALALAEAALTPTPPAATDEMASTSQEDVEEAAPEAAEPTLPDVDEVVAELTEPLTGSDAQAPAPEAHPAPATPAESPAVSPEAPAAAPEAPAPAPEAPVQAAQEPANPVPTSIPAPVAEAVSAVAQQVQPLNVNISLRFESPGDNGPVSQLNAAVADVVAQFAPAPQPETQYQPTESQYHAPSHPAASAPAPETPPATENQAQPVSEPEEQWDWTWQWNCGDAIPPEIALPGNSLLPIWNWNWEWNCGGNPDPGGNSETQLPNQYHAAATQYQPININISIRVLSPGNDGPVTQVNIAHTNVAVTVHASLPVIPTPVVTPAPVTLPSSGGPAPAGTAPTAVSAPAQSSSPAGGLGEVATEPAVLPVAIAVDLECCVAPATAPGRLAVDDGGVRHPEIAGMLGTADDDSGGGPMRGDTAGASTGTAQVVPVSAEAIASLAPPQPAVEAAKRAKAQEQLKQPQKAAPKDERAAALGYAGVSPLATPDKSAKLFFLYLIPFAFALVDAARRVLGEQTPTAADPGRPQERPG